LSYGDNPCVKYHGPSNSIIITVKQKTADANIVDSIQKLETNISKENIDQWNKIQNKIKSSIEMIKALPIGNEQDENGNRLIYKRLDILLQKWNNIVLNYSGGTLDVFYNGELVKSSIEVVPKLSYDMLTVGTENGISGNIANLMYFNHPLNYLTVNRLYTMLKDKNPPTISTINQTLIPIPEQVVDTSENVSEKVVDTSKNVSEKVVDTSKNVSEKVVDTSKNISEKVVDTSKKSTKRTKNTFNI
jgi:gas vesicle protein